MVRFVVLGAGCSDAVGPPDDGQWHPSSRERRLVTEIIEELVNDTRWVASATHPAFGQGYPDVGFSHSLPGTEEFLMGVMTMVPDLEPGPYEPYCLADGGDHSPPAAGFWETRDRCLRVVKEEGDVWRVDNYFTMRPHRLPDVEHEFRYPVEGGEIIFDPNPKLSWRAAVLPDGAARIQLEFDRRLVFRGGGSEDIDLAHQGTVDAAHDDPEQTTDHFEMVFPRLAPGGSVTVQQARNVAPFTVIVGVISYLGCTIADIAATESGVVVSWR